MPSAPAETRRKQESAAVLQSDLAPPAGLCLPGQGTARPMQGPRPRRDRSKREHPQGHVGMPPSPSAPCWGCGMEEKEHGAAAACSALRKAAGERRFVGLWLQARLVRHSPAKTYMSRILCVSNACFTWRPLFLSVNKKVGSEDNGTFKTPSVPISFTLGLAATFLCCLT